MSDYSGIPHTPGVHGRSGGNKQVCPACRQADRDRRQRRDDQIRQLQQGRVWYSKSRDPQPDEVAVRRACDGHLVVLTTAERNRAVQILTGRGLSAYQIAQQLRVTVRSVQRRRQAVRLQQGVAA